MTFTLTEAEPTKTVAIAAHFAEVKVGSAGTWSGSVDISYEIGGESVVYEEGSFTGNFNKRFSPLTDFTTFTLTGTGTAHIEVNTAKFAK